jgi:hypothetical protein
MRHQLGGLGTPGQSREEICADRADHVVPPVCQHPERQVGDIGMLLGEQLAD